MISVLFFRIFFFALASPPNSFVNFSLVFCCIFGSCFSKSIWNISGTSTDELKIDPGLHIPQRISTRTATKWRWITPVATIRKGYNNTDWRTDWWTDWGTDWWTDGLTDGRTCQRAHLGPHANCKSQISFCTQLIKWSTHIQRIQIQIQIHVDVRYIYSLQFTAHLNCRFLPRNLRREKEKKKLHRHLQWRNRNKFAKSQIKNWGNINSRAQRGRERDRYMAKVSH